jgi:hypothetical protein
MRLVILIICAAMLAGCATHFNASCKVVCERGY